MEAQNGDKYLVDDQSKEQLKDQAADFLKSGYFFVARQFYKKLLEEEPENTDYHIACLMAENNIKEEYDLIRYYQDLYSEPEYEYKIASDLEIAHFEEMAEKSYVPNYLEKEEIRRLYDYDLAYESCLACRKKQKEEILRLIDQDEHLLKLKQKGFKQISEIIKAYDRRIDEAENSDKKNAERIRNDYQRFIYKTYSKVKELNKKAKEEKDSDYRSLISRYEKSDDKDELRELILAFERFEGYKKAQEYVVKCQEKIEYLKGQEEESSLKQRVDTAITQARKNLIRKRYGQAYDGFAKAISMDQENEDAHLGILMAQTKTNDIDELFEYYRNLYSEDKKQSLIACEEDRKHIDEMIEKYHLPDYLEKETIEEKYLFDRSYLSSLDNRLRQAEQISEDLNGNPVFLWLKENGCDDTKRRIDDLFETYEGRVLQAKDEDDKNIEKIRNEYQRFLFKTYADIKKLYHQANNQKDEEYRDILSLYKISDSEDELNDLIERLEALDGYKDSEDYISLCHKKIDDLRKLEKDALIRQEIETTLIAGRTYLLSGNRDLADRSFAKVLSLDENNPYAYLGILILETGVKDYESLIEYYSRLYHEDIPESLEGCPLDRDHIETIAEKYHIPGYFEKDQIRKYYSFDRSYESYTQSRIDQKRQLEEEFDLNPLLIKIFANRNNEINEIFDRILDSYDERIRQSKESDEKQCRSIEHIYQIYLKETDRTLEKIYDEKLKERNEDYELRYQENVSLYNSLEDVKKLEELAGRFEQDKDYKDSSDYVEKCNEKIRTIRVENERDTLDSLFNEGDELLEKRLFNQAKEKFISYLNIDPDDEDAHLYLLMSETGSLNLDELADHYKDLYLDDEIDVFFVEEDRRDHIEEICEKCHIPGELEKEEIRKQYDFDLSYESVLRSRLQARKEIEAELDLNPSLSWLKEKGSSKIRDLIDDILDTYEKRITEAQKSDRDNVDKITKEYRSFVREKDREIRSLYNSLLKERNEEAKKSQKEKRAFELRQKEEEERLRKAQAEKERAELEQIEAEKQKLLESEREEKRKAREKIELEKQAQRKLEKERKKQERAEFFKQIREKKEKPVVLKPVEEKKPFRPNIGIVMAVISLLILGAVSYTYLLVPMNRYKNAVSLAEEKRYDDAIALFSELGDYKDSVYKVKETSYLKADDLYESGDLIAAANAFKDLRFDDSEDRIKAIKDQLMKNAKIGDVIIFGQYEQDGDLGNGREFIEWEVLDITEGSMLVISKYGIEAQKFNSTSNETYWINSTLRTWLNGRFADNAFDAENPSIVLQSSLENYMYPFTTDEISLEEDDSEMEMYETRDNLFLLSEDEVLLYYPEESSRKCMATEYAIENGVGANADNSCSWWLRSCNSVRDNTTQIVRGTDGVIGASMYEITNAIRPAMWLKHD